MTGAKAAAQVPLFPPPTQADFPKLPTLYGLGLTMFQKQEKETPVEDTGRRPQFTSLEKQWFSWELLRK